MDLEGAFLDLEGALLHSLQKSRGPWPLWSPGSYVPDSKIPAHYSVFCYAMHITCPFTVFQCCDEMMQYLVIAST